MNVKSDKHSEQADRAAREWFVLMQSDSVTDAQKREFEVWLTARQEHGAAYRQLSNIWDRLATLSATAEGARLRRSVESGSASSRFGQMIRPASPVGFFFSHRLAATAATAAIALLVFSAGLVWLLGKPQSEVELRYATATNEIRVVRLSDNTQVTLGGKSELIVAFTERARTLTLQGGEAFFDVTSDPGRPFIVNVNDISVTVAGTQFDVRKRYAGASVSVLEGRVQVAANGSAPNASTALLILTAGEQVSKPLSGGFSDVIPVTAFELGAWRNGRLIYKDAQLIDVITDANRYFDGSISLQVTDIYDEAVTLTLRTDQVDDLPEMLAAAGLPIEVRRLPDGRIDLVSATNNN